MLVVAGENASTELLQKLSERGYFCAAADSPASVLSIAAKLKPEAVLFGPTTPNASEVLATLRSDHTLKNLPVLADVSQGRAESLHQFGVDDWIHSHDELTVRLEAALRAKRLVERDALARRRMEFLLDITQAATSSLELDQVLRIAVEKVGQAIASDRCSVVLVEGTSPRAARVVASREIPELAAPFALDLGRYPELRRALETRQVVHVEDAARDPLMEEVRRYVVPLGVKSVLVQPLVSHDDILGALFLRLSKSEEAFGLEEREFAQAVAAALANSIRNARLHAALRKKREDLESAYIDRYRELSEANRRLKELNRLKDDIIAVCSHDLRAPLQVLLGHGRLLLDGELAPQQRASVEAVVRMGKKILELVESLLERGKGDSARIALDARLLDVSEVCQESAAELEILAAERAVAIRAETPECLMAIGDEVKLRQVLQNLITNAIHHARPQGEVVVRTQRIRRPDGDAARVMVQDDGEGIPSEQLHLVFDKYRHGGGGTGLGLAICKEFVELHGGEIWAERAPDGGTCFVFTVPLASEGASAAALVGSAVLAPAQQPQILVVEDEPEVAAIVAEILRSRYRVEVARDGAEGLAKARSLHPDLIIMDVFLPKLDGLDAAVALKSSSDTADIPVILLSAHQGVSEKVRALNLGAVDYMGKPFQGLELLNRVERALKLSNTERELSRSQTLLRRAGSDPETGLYDRGGLVARLEQERARSVRYRRPLSVAVLRPLDKPGERLRTCAALLRRSLRVPDLVGHLGEGVLAVVLPESRADAVRQTLARLVPEIQQETGVRFVTSAMEIEPQDPSGPEELLERVAASAVIP